MGWIWACPRAALNETNVVQRHVWKGTSESEAKLISVSSVLIFPAANGGSMFEATMSRSPENPTDSVRTVGINQIRTL